ncbi:MAG: hypothetical protein ACRCTI_19160, partial [Beijerinckiaceae bacterium]
MASKLGISAFAAFVLGTLGAMPAQAQQSSCQTDFQKLLEPRQALIQRINNFQKQRPTPQAACSTLSQLVAQDVKLNKWLEENKDWCQIPDNVVEQFKEGSGSATRARGQACGAAKQQAAAMARARAQQRAAQGGG